MSRRQRDRARARQEKQASGVLGSAFGGPVAPVEALRIPPRPPKDEQFFDPDLDVLLRERGWFAFRDEYPESTDCWEWIASVPVADDDYDWDGAWTAISVSAHGYLVEYAYMDTADRPTAQFATRDELLRELDTIEAYRPPARP
ncbi:hypothetical protein [Mycobacteroides abscessus]|uniref:hypothetical protein n=1 Tax=Mycobacteroides abscessus TaxID=36809 RepID=UPI00092B2EAC|nr:hypothetical protein [Mycobacteroides abscessus]SHQ66692.1 Uncharacterised protein [Mycobacteroides abscessus subsp. abscessus]SHR24402.1 Uncharacterised protein [Mycobacteroides abscessus subsp. abscessus]SHS16607.1 Uncharacterised protein [Mycobacteroides abscessus subsp. abscessus]SHT44132.1 Uncharacterised protein [Mycobacteroides abscessus subsp. abscessus]SHT58476.1 Uncharacterised protein [Mycobacteroides abscessus subsp. abscessus]